MATKPLAYKEDEVFFRTSFARVYAAGVDPEFFEIVQRSAGMAVSQSAGNLVLTTGTGTNEETILRSTRAFAGAITLREVMTLSQRIANNNLYVELVDVIGDALPFVVNSATSVTVNIPGHRFDDMNIGQFMNIGACQSLANTIPGRYAIASVKPDYVTFTVASWPSSGSGTCSVFGWNHHKILYNGTTATNAAIDSQREGWDSGDTTITINTTASPGHMATVNVEDGVVSWMDQLVASSPLVQQIVRGSRVANIPDDGVNLFVQIRALNGTVAPASTTTMTLGLLSVEQYAPCDVSISSVRPQSLNHALPVSLVASNNTSSGAMSLCVQGPTAHDAVLSGNPVRAAGRALTANYTTVASGDAADIVTTLVGAQIVKNFSIPEADWTYAAAASGIVNTTTAVTFKTAAAAGIRNYLTGMDIMWESLTNATELAIRDGAAGTVIWRTKIPATSAGRMSVNFPTPLKGTAATLMEVVTLTASGAGAVYFNAQGYIAP